MSSHFSLPNEEELTMTRVVINADLRSKLPALTQPLELCDEAGNVLGQFTPVLDLSQYEPLEPQVSEEELDRREQESEWYTTAEVLAHLEKL
jgi:hypothetical protein